ncbi:homoserine O-succinyltransferase [Dysgonomonas sp. 520]|uniref:homoserine O-acetyltransferase MetA n=1 Tax=Dysgonomonas sp. 520 TaxID=2302931 RepID=UPI0013D06BE6|nr:homoserine O-succinyltransferase [Dysgonomonas sp. 520]NDW09152.1 homoserine O-succinyltransferase [Dysgonomonas sp. 520]
MPVTLPDNLPAIELLKKENIFVMSQLRASSQDIRPLKVVVLNLMPMKIATETDLVRLLSNTPLQIDLSLVKLSTHQSKHTPEEHMLTFYKEFDEIKKENYDGMIITGAPVEHLNYEDVNYWNELSEIFDWARKHVTSTFYICWAAQAALYRFYGIPKHNLPEKMFGVFKHTINDRNYPLFRGFDDEFYAPHSRHTEIRKEDIEKHPELKLLSESEEAGVYIVIGRGGREFYVTGHSEYSLYTLHNEYVRDKEKGLDIVMPKHYYKHDDPDQKPISRWTGHGNLLFNNWINYYLYQETPYNLSEVEKMDSIKTLDNK